jgi:hypothetical protein
MQRPRAIASRWPHAGVLACLGLLACGPAPGEPDATTDATTASSTAPTSSGEPTGPTEPTPSTSTSTSATTSTSDDPDTGATTTSTPICETCTDDEICVEVLDVHTCGFPGESDLRCVPNPHGCVPTDPCSTACHDLCGPAHCEGEPMCSTTAGALQCWTYQLQPGWNCDALAQDDCIAGKKCVPGFEGDHTLCTPILEPMAAVGEACEGPTFERADNCAAGAVCFAGTCAELCSPETLQCADPAATCEVPGELVGVCLHTCEPLAPACAADEVCVDPAFHEGLFVCMTDASGAGGQALMSCETGDECDPGLTCLGAHRVSAECESQACCTPYCDLLGDAPCPAPDQTCQPYFNPQNPPPGHESLGACGIPP